MIPASDMKFYLDPVQDMTLKADRLYVTEEAYPRVRDSLVGTIVTVKENGYDTGSGKFWRVTTDGHFVDGAPISRNSPNYQPHIGLLDDGHFVVGEYYGTMNIGAVAILAGCVRSDGKKRPGGGNQYRVAVWLKAAPWAARCMPEPGDSADVIAAKITLARELHKRRNAMRVILTEAMERDWNKDLEPLREDHDIPRPAFGAYVEGDVMMAVDGASTTRYSDLNQTERDRVTRLTGRTYSDDARLDQRISVPVKFMASLSITPDSSFTAINSSTITSSARSRFDDYSLSMGSFSLSPVLRTLAS